MFGGNKNTKRVKQIIPEFTEVIMQWGVDASTATRFAEKHADKALENTLKVLAGHDEGENVGELLASGNSPTSYGGNFFINRIKASQPQLDADGVTYEDMMWYWSMPLLERMIIREMSNAYRLGLSLIVMQSRDWDSKEQMAETAAYQCNLNTARYADFEDMRQVLDAKDSTRPFPFELYKRIETYRNIPWDEATKAKLKKHDNLNSFLRAQMKVGIL